MKHLSTLIALLWTTVAFSQTSTVTYTNDANKRIVQPLLKVRSGGSITIESGGNITLNSGSTLATAGATISGANTRLVPTGSTTADFLQGGTTPTWLGSTGSGKVVREDNPLFINNPIQTTAGMESYGYIKMIAAATVPGVQTGNVGFYFQTGNEGVNLMGYGANYDIAFRNRNGTMVAGLVHDTGNFNFFYQPIMPNGVRFPGTTGNAIDLRGPSPTSGGIKTVYLPNQSGTLAVAGTPLIAATTAAVTTTGTTTVSGTGVGTEFGTAGSVILLEGQPFKTVSSPDANTIVVANPPPALTAVAPLKLANNHMFEVKNYDGTVVFSVEPDGTTNTSGQINCVGGANLVGFLSQQGGPVILGNSGSTDYVTILAGNNVAGLTLTNTLSGSDISNGLFVGSVWNTSGNAALIQGNVGLTAAGANSRLLKLTVNSASKFEVDLNGNIQTPTIRKRPFSTKTANYTLTTADDTIYANATGGNITMTLPTPASAGGSGVTQSFRIKRIDSSANTVTVQVSGGANMDTYSSMSLSPYYSADFQSNGTQYYIH